MSGWKGEKVLMEQKQAGSKSKTCLGEKEFGMGSEISMGLYKIRYIFSFIF